MGDDGFAWGFELERKVRKLLCLEAGVAQVNRGRLSQHRFLPPPPPPPSRTINKSPCEDLGCLPACLPACAGWDS